MNDRLLNDRALRDGTVVRRSRGLLPAFAATALTVAAVLGTGGCSSGGDDEALGIGVAKGQLIAGGSTGTAPPPTEAAAGALVPGFPTALLPMPRGTTVTASAVQRHDGLMDVSMSATTSTPSAEVLDFYAVALGRAGFSRTSGSVLPPGAIGLAFSRDGGRELLVVAVVDRRGLRSFSVGGTVVGQG